jgi:hypothetical protein
MPLSRLITLVLAIVASCGSSGCLAVYSTCPADFVVTATDSGKPLANLPVTVSYLHSVTVGAPEPVNGTTDQQGRVVLPVADSKNFFPMSLQVGNRTFQLDPNIVQDGGVLTEWQSSANACVQQKITVRLGPRPKSAPPFLKHYSIYSKAGGL